MVEGLDHIVEGLHHHMRAARDQIWHACRRPPAPPSRPLLDPTPTTRHGLAVVACR